jgi:hypothetical protein
MPEAVGNARRQRPVLLGALHGSVGARMPRGLRAPAREDGMSLKKEAVLAYIAEAKVATYDAQSKEHAHRPLGGEFTFANLLSWRIGSLVELEETILAGEFDA